MNGRKRYKIGAILAVLSLALPALACAQVAGSVRVSNWVAISANPVEIPVDGVSASEIDVVVASPEGSGEPAVNATLELWTTRGWLTEVGNNRNTGAVISLVTDVNGTATALLSGNETGVADIVVVCLRGGWNFTAVTFRERAATTSSDDRGSTAGASPRILYVDAGGSANFMTIQAAVDNATAGDIIIVRNGTYSENVKVNVNKANVTIRSEHGLANTIVQAAQPTDYVFDITADYVCIRGFTVKGATDAYSHLFKNGGISLGRDVAYCTIADNNVTGNHLGIVLSSSGHNRITSNHVESNSASGIFLYHSITNEFENNSVSENSDTGILMRYSNSNDFVGNMVSSNGNYGLFLTYSNENLFYHNNLVNNGNNVYDDQPEMNLWNHPVLPEGNYWSDYTGMDDGSGTGTHAIAGDGTGDTAIPHPAPGFDYYPFMNESGWERLWQNTIETIETATGIGTATLSTDNGYFSSVVAVNESSLPPQGKPNISFPYGFFRYVIGGLKSGDNVTVTVELPADLPANSPYWLYNQNSRSWQSITPGDNDGDNVITLTLKDGGVGDEEVARGVISGTGGPALLADLALKPTDIYVLLVNQTEGDGVSVNITATVHNIGGVAANNFTVAFFYFNGTARARIGDVNISTVSAASNANASIPWTAAPGAHNISVVADAGGIIAESNETNNDANVTITVESDLYPANISFPRENPTEGDSVTIGTVVRNSGWTDAREFNVSFFVDDALIGKGMNISVTALSNVSAAITWKAVTGEHNIRVFTDSGDMIPESNETNNNASRVIQVKEKESTRTGGGGGGGGGGLPLDTDGDGYSDLTEMLEDTDWRDPNDYPGAQLLTLTPAPTPTVTSTPLPTETLTPAPTPSPTPGPQKRLPGFEAVFAVAALALLAVTYLLQRRA